MNIAEMSAVVDGIAQGLASALKAPERKEIASLAAVFRRFPNQSIADFVKFVEGSFLKERNSPPALIERVRACHENSGEPREELWKSLSTVGAADLKTVVKGLQMKPASTKAANLDVLAAHLGLKTAGDGTTAAETPAAEEVEKAFREYSRIRSHLGQLSIDEIRSEFLPIANRPKPVLDAVLRKLGYPGGGPKDELVRMLLGNLEGIKVSLDQTSRIRSPEMAEGEPVLR